MRAVLLTCRPAPLIHPNHIPNSDPLLGPFHGAIAVPSVTRCRCCRCCRCCCGHRCAGGVRQRRTTVATPGEWQCKTGGVRRLAVANGPNIFQMLLVWSFDLRVSACPELAVDYMSRPNLIMITQAVFLLQHGHTHTHTHTHTYTYIQTHLKALAIAVPAA